MISTKFRENKRGADVRAKTFSETPESMLNNLWLVAMKPLGLLKEGKQKNPPWTKIFNIEMKNFININFALINVRVYVQPAVQFFFF